jgi:hypothetical protein
MPESSPRIVAVPATLSRRALPAAFVVASLLTGCRDGGSAPAAPAPGSARPAARPAIDPAIATANRTMAAGVPMGDGTAPVEARFDLPSVPAPGEPFLVRVAILPSAPAPVLRVDVTTSQGLVVLVPDGPLTFEKVAAGSVVPFDVRAESGQAGARVMSVKVTLDLPDGPQSRIFAFPVLVGAPPAATPPPAPAAPAASAKPRVR